jgi:hypothetical protein
MKLLELGLSLLRHYEQKLNRRELVSAQDLRLATWAVETTYRHRHQHSMWPHMLSALGALQMRTTEFEKDPSNRIEVQTTLAILNEQLGAVVEDTTVFLPVLDTNGALRLPEVILNRLSEEIGRSGLENTSEPLKIPVSKTSN